MSILKYKVKLSPKLQLGVGRNRSGNSLWRYGTMIVLVFSGVLVIRAGYMLIHKSSTITQAQPQVLGAEDTNQTPKQLFKEYVVKKGDTIFSIGQSNGIEWTTLATLNGLEAPFTLHVGQILKIPQQ